MDGLAVEVDAPKSGTGSVWALGDYHRFAKTLVWSLGEDLVDECGNVAGVRFLDVATGTGNTAIRAAAAGARVVGLDITPENFAAARREAAEQGVEVEWVEGDAQAMPFGDAEFEVVASSLGAIFAPDHGAVASEMARVCRPGGRLAMINFTPEGLAAEFFGVFAPYMPPPPQGSLPPVMWGSEEHVAKLLTPSFTDLRLHRRHYVERAESPRAYCEFVKQTFGPVIAIYRSLSGDPASTQQLDERFLQFVERASRITGGGQAELRYEILLVNGTKEF